MLNSQTHAIIIALNIFNILTCPNTVMINLSSFGANLLCIPYVISLAKSLQTRTIYRIRKQISLLASRAQWHSVKSLAGFKLFFLSFKNIINVYHSLNTVRLECWTINLTELQRCNPAKVHGDGLTLDFSIPVFLFGFCFIGWFCFYSHCFSFITHATTHPPTPTHSQHIVRTIHTYILLV